MRNKKKKEENLTEDEFVAQQVEELDIDRIHRICGEIVFGPKPQMITKRDDILFDIKMELKPYHNSLRIVAGILKFPNEMFGYVRSGNLMVLTVGSTTQLFGVTSLLYWKYSNTDKDSPRVCFATLVQIGEMAYD